MLEVLGNVFLILIALVAAFGIWLFIKIKGGMAHHARVTAIEESMHMPALVLEPNEQPSFAHPEAVAMLVKQAVDLGAISCGNFDVPAAGARMCAYCLERPPVYIAITDHDQVEPWTDVVLHLEGGRSFAASTVPEIGRGAPRPPEDELMPFAPGTATGVLVRAATERAENDTAVPAPAEAFKAYFEEQAEKSQRFIETQAVSQDWLDTIAEGTGVELSGDEAEQINFLRENQQMAETESACFESLANSGDLTAAEWNKVASDLVAVWDDMPPEYVSGVFYSHVDFPDGLEVDVEALEKGRGNARARVAAVNAKLPPEQRLHLVGQVSSPVEADIYCGQTPVV